MDKRIAPGESAAGGVDVGGVSFGSTLAAARPVDPGCCEPAGGTGEDSCGCESDIATAMHAPQSWGEAVRPSDRSRRLIDSEPGSPVSEALARDA